MGWIQPSRVPLPASLFCCCHCSTQASPLPPPVPASCLCPRGWSVVGQRGMVCMAEGAMAGVGLRGPGTSCCTGELLQGRCRVQGGGSQVRGQGTGGPDTSTSILVPLPASLRSAQGLCPAQLPIVMLLHCTSTYDERTGSAEKT